MYLERVILERTGLILGKLREQVGRFMRVKACSKFNEVKKLLF